VHAWYQEEIRELWGLALALLPKLRLEALTDRPCMLGFMGAVLLLCPLLAACTAALAAPVRAVAYRVVVEVETRSDWTHVTVQGLVISSYELVEGSDAPGLRVEVGDGEIGVGKRQYDTTLVRVRINGYLVFVAEESEVEVEKGDLEYTTVRIYGVEDGVEVLVWSFTNSGVVPGSGGA